MELGVQQRLETVPSISKSKTDLLLQYGSCGRRSFIRQWAYERRESALIKRTERCVNQIFPILYAFLRKRLGVVPYIALKTRRK